MFATDFSQVGVNIQTAIKAKGLTQQQLADQLSVSKQVMSKIINGTKAINVNEIARIASVLDTSVDQLLTVPETPKQDDTLRFMGSITDEGTKEKVDLIRGAIDQIHLLEGFLNE